MNKLTRDQIQTKLKFAYQLSDVGEDIQDSIKRYNQLIEAARTEIEGLVGRYNELVQDAQGMMEGIHDEQEAYKGDRSDRWQDSDAGQAYTEWMDAWAVDLEEMDIVLPDEIEEPSLDALDVLRDLPDKP